MGVTAHGAGFLVGGGDGGGKSSKIRLCELLVLTAAAGAPGLFLRLLILSGSLCQHSMAAKPW